MIMWEMLEQQPIEEGMKQITRDIPNLSDVRSQITEIIAKGSDRYQKKVNV